MNQTFAFEFTYHLYLGNGKLEPTNMQLHGISYKVVDLKNQQNQCRNNEKKNIKEEIKND